MSKAIKFKTYATAGIACLALLATSCSTDEDDGTTLPDGKYPVTFTASVNGLTATRATTVDNEWEGSENVAIQIGSTVKRYTVGQGGILTAADAANTFYWQSSGETKSVSAWYCGDGSTGAGGSNISAIPTSWEVKTDQSGDGYQQSDFLYAPATSIAFNSSTGGTANSLAFHHQTAKVIINIKSAEAATDASAIESVVIGHDNNLSLKGTYSMPTGNNTVGTWTPTTGTDDMGTIIAKKLTTAGTLAGGTTTALASYAALVIPQDMKGKKFIAITLSDGSSGSNTYCYTPTQDGDADLQGGKQHTYDITVKHGYLEVGVSTSPQWTGSNETITGNGQTVTPGTDGNGSSWTQDSSNETITGIEKSNNP